MVNRTNDSWYWTDEELSTLQRLTSSNANLTSVMAALPNRTFLAVILKMRESISLFPKITAEQRSKIDYSDQTKSYSDLFPNRNKPWTFADNQQLKQKFENGDNLYMLMVAFGRSNKSIRKQLMAIYPKDSDKEALYEQTKFYLKLKKA